jgi:hypothetical protein
VSDAPSTVQTSDASEPPHVDPLAADRRTIVIAVVVMVALVLVGVVSGSLFARSACRLLAPEGLTATVASDPDLVVAAAFPEASDATANALVDAITDLAGELGPLTAVADATGTERLALTSGSATALGEVTSVIGAADGGVRATAGFDPAATVVGDGSSLYSLALTNPLTGQVDALQPVDLDLEPGTCVDTALVGSPLAFHLAAGFGQLALLRVDEDGSDPVLELRDPFRGRVWASGLDLGPAPAGILGEWVTAALGDDMVVVGRRSRPGDEQPVVAAFERRGGAARWDRSREELATALADLEPLSDSSAEPAAGTVDATTDLPTPLPETSATVVEVVAIDGELVLVLLSPQQPDDEDVDAASDTTPSGPSGRVLVALGAATGEPVWSLPLTTGASVEVVTAVEETAWVLLGDADRVNLVEVDPRGFVVAVEQAGEEGHAARLPDRRLMVATADGAVIDDGGEVLARPFVVRDVAVAHEQVWLLLDGPDGGTVLAGYGARRD